jgi:hypothetical protein
MPYYVKVESTTYGILTAQCGSTTVADRLGNTNNDVAGADFSYVYAYNFNIEQPHNEHGAGTISAAPALHSVILTTPDYEPMLAGAINILAGQDIIKQVTFNIAAVKQGGNKLLAQYTLEDGMLINYQHIISDQRSLESQRQRGHIILAFKFKKITMSNKITNTEGSLTTTTT